MMVRRGLLALLLGAAASLFETSSAFLIPSGPKAAVGRVSREQHHQVCATKNPRAKRRRLGQGPTTAVGSNDANTNTTIKPYRR